MKLIKVFGKISNRIVLIRFLIHYIYHLIFQIRILKIPRQLIYDLSLFPSTFGDFVHVVSISQALSKKFNGKGLNKVLIIYEFENEENKKFIESIVKPLVKILDDLIIVECYSKHQLTKKSEIYKSIFPYFPSFHRSNDSYRFYKPIDQYLLARFLDLRVYDELKIDIINDRNYINIAANLKDLISSQYYCFSLRESHNKHTKAIRNQFFHEKYWDSSSTIECIKYLLSKGEKVIIINPLSEKYNIPGVIEIAEATWDPIVRYFIYIHATKVFSVASGPASLLLHSKKTKYLIYDEINISKFYDKSFFKKNTVKENKDWVHSSDCRLSKWETIGLEDL